MGAWIRMNGSTGCMPDSIDAHEDQGSAIDSARQMFDDIPDASFADMANDLFTHGIHYFDADDNAGADYVSVEYDTTANTADYDEEES